MARSKTAQPKHSLRKIAVVVATAVSGMSVYAQAAVFCFFGAASHQYEGNLLRSGLTVINSDWCHVRKIN